MSGVSAITHKNKVTVNFAASSIIDKKQVYAAARRLKHTSCYHRYGSTVEFYIPDMYLERFVNRAANNGLDVII
ncbi:hypothetical protein IJZ97_02545 [bacterium]|nr:hypothetical protein [bacterium]